MILTGNEGCKCESNLDVDVTTGHVYQHPSFDGARLASISPTKERLALAGERRRLDVGGVWWGNVTVLLLYPCHHFPSHPPPTPPPPPSSPSLAASFHACFLFFESHQHAPYHLQPSTYLYSTRKYAAVLA